MADLHASWCTSTCYVARVSGEQWEQRDDWTNTRKNINLPCTRQPRVQLSCKIIFPRLSFSEFTCRGIQSLGIEQIKCQNEEIYPKYDFYTQFCFCICKVCRTVCPLLHDNIVMFFSTVNH